MTDIAQESNYLSRELFSIFPVVWKSSLELTEATKEYKRAKMRYRAAMEIASIRCTEYMDTMTNVRRVNDESKE